MKLTTTATLPGPRPERDGEVQHYSKTHAHDQHMLDLLVHLTRRRKIATGDELCLDVLEMRLWGLDREDLGFVRGWVASKLLSLCAQGRLQAVNGTKKLKDSFALPILKYPYIIINDLRPATVSIRFCTEHRVKRVEVQKSFRTGADVEAAISKGIDHWVEAKQTYRRLPCFLTCVYCEKTVDEDYVVHNRIWRAAGLHPTGGRVHIQCLARLLDRPLVLEDFPETLPINATLFLGAKLITEGGIAP